MHMHVREALHLLASSHFLAYFLFLLTDIAHMIHIRFIAHMAQNLVKHSLVASITYENLR